MPYLSRVYLNPLRRGAQRLIANPQAMHAAVLGGIPEQPVQSRVLWRLEPFSERDGTWFRGELLVATDVYPSLEHIVEQAGWAQVGDPPQSETRSLEPLLDALRLGRAFAMRVKVNPVTSRRSPQALPVSPGGNSPDLPRGKVMAVGSAARQAEWLKEHSPGWGFEVQNNSIGEPDIRPVQRETLSFRRRNGQPPVTLSTATFDAHVRVVDPMRARECLVRGVGRAKAYGCGLITLAAPQSSRR